MHQNERYYRELDLREGVDWLKLDWHNAEVINLSGMHGIYIVQTSDGWWFAKNYYLYAKREFPVEYVYRLVRLYKITVFRTRMLSILSARRELEQLPNGKVAFRR